MAPWFSAVPYEFGLTAFCFLPIPIKMVINVYQLVFGVQRMLKYDNEELKKKAKAK
jgi:hypothetical protein